MPWASFSTSWPRAGGSFQEAPSQIVEAILHQKPEIPRTIDPQISEGLERIIFKCLEKEPADRYASARDLIADLKRLEGGDLAGLIAGKASQGSKRSLWRRLAPLGAAAALGLAGLVRPEYRWRERARDRPVRSIRRAVAVLL
jgi:serine/threonine-protein kinase